MHDKGPRLPPAGRDVAGAWLICALIAVLALGLMSNLRQSLPPAATVAAEVTPCRPAADSICGVPGAAAGRHGDAAAWLHFLALPTGRPGEQRPRS